MCTKAGCIVSKVRGPTDIRAPTRSVLSEESGDWQGVWGLARSLGTGKESGDWQGVWGLARSLGTGKESGDWQGVWGLARERKVSWRLHQDLVS